MNDTPPPVTTEQLLAAWRAAERELEGTGTGTPEHQDASYAAQQAAEAYQQRLNENTKLARELANPGDL